MLFWCAWASTWTADVPSDDLSTSQVLQLCVTLLMIIIAGPWWMMTKSEPLIPCRHGQPQRLVLGAMFLSRRAPQLVTIPQAQSALPTWQSVPRTRKTWTSRCCAHTQLQSECINAVCDDVHCAALHILVHTCSVWCVLCCAVLCCAWAELYTKSMQSTSYKRCLTPIIGMRDKSRRCSWLSVCCLHALLSYIHNIMLMH